MQQQSSSNVLLSIPEAAEFLSVSPATVWRRVYSGEIVSLKIGSIRRIRMHDLEAFIEQQERYKPKPLTEERRRSARRRKVADGY